VAVQRRLGILVGVIVAAAALAMWLLRSDAGTPLSPTGAGSDGVVAAAERAGLEMLPPTRLPSDIERRDATVAADAVPMLCVQVVDKATGEPVAGAEVAADDPDADLDRLSPLEQFEVHRILDPFLRLQRIGQRAVTDAGGRANLRRAPAGMTICAAADERYGVLQIQGPPPPAGYRLWLVPDLGVHVRVVDALGKPLAAVPLGLTAEFVRAGAATGDRSSWPVAFTDGDGCAVVRHLQDLARDYQGRQPRDLQVVVRAPGLMDIAAPVHPAVGGGPTVTLSLSAFGSIAVHLQDRRGRPLPGREVFGLSLSYRERETPSVPWDDTSFEAEAFGSEGSYPYVGLGLQLTLYGYVASVGLERALSGPVRHGEKVHVNLALGDGQCAIVRGRLLAADHTPLPAAEIMLVRTDNYMVQSPARTGADGRFEVYVAREGIDGVTSIRVQTRDQRWVPTATSAPVPLVCRNDEAELGDVVLQLPVAVASGRVVAASGPLPEHQWQVERCAPGAGDEWETTATMAVREAKDGTFAVVSLEPHPDGRLRLRVVGTECAPMPPIPFTDGQSDLLVTLTAGADLRLRILVDDELLACGNLFNCDLRRSDGDGQAQAWPQIVDGAFECRFAGLVAGVWRLQVSAFGLSVADVDGIALGRGADADPRVDPLDLRGKLHLLRLRCVDEAGRVIDCSGGGVIAEFDSGARKWGTGFAVEHGLAALCTASAHCEVLLAMNGFQPVRWVGRPGSADVRMEPSFAVNLEFTGIAALDAASLYCRVSHRGASTFAKETGVPRGHLWGLDNFDSLPLQKGRASPPLSEAGDYQVSLMLAGLVGREEGDTVILGTFPFAVAAVGPAEVRIAVPEAVVARAQELLRGR
jgi:hypothetical protein